MSKLLDWNGQTVPAELKAMKPGRYMIEAVDEIPELSREEEEGLEAALRSVRAGRGVPAETAEAIVRGALKR